jgi:hypothetical protein
LTRWFHWIKIQDINVITTCCGLPTVDIGTSSGGAQANVPEVTLYSPQDAHRVREEIMNRREVLMFAGRQAAGGGGMDRYAVQQQPQANPTMNELAMMKEQVARMERQMAQGQGQWMHSPIYELLGKHQYI